MHLCLHKMESKMIKKNQSKLSVRIIGVCANGRRWVNGGAECSADARGKAAGLQETVLLFACLLTGSHMLSVNHTERYRRPL